LLPGSAGPGGSGAEGSLPHPQVQNSAEPVRQSLAGVVSRGSVGVGGGSCSGTGRGLVGWRDLGTGGGLLGATGRTTRYRPTPGVARCRDPGTGGGLFGATGRTTRYRMARCTGWSARWCVWSAWWFGRAQGQVRSGELLGARTGSGDLGQGIACPRPPLGVQGPDSCPSEPPRAPRRTTRAAPPTESLNCGRTSQRLRA